MILGLDFDGTCVTHEFPEIGKDIGAIPVLKKIQNRGHRIILNTIRCDKGPNEMYLSEAVKWFKDNGIRLFGINRNPIQSTFSTSPKVFADLYIDDLNLGCPLRVDKNLSASPFVDWIEVEKYLKQNNWI